MRTGWVVKNQSANGGPGLRWFVESEDGLTAIVIHRAPNAEQMAHRVAALPGLLEACERWIRHADTIPAFTEAELERLPILKTYLEDVAIARVALARAMETES